METRFCCPKCGDDRFGTDNPCDPADQMVGRCYLCNFTWMRTRDDEFFRMTYDGNDMGEAIKQGILLVLRQENPDWRTSHGEPDCWLDAQVEAAYKSFVAAVTAVEGSI